MLNRGTSGEFELEYSYTDNEPEDAEGFSGQLWIVYDTTFVEKAADLTVWYIVGGITGVLIIVISVLVVKRYCIAKKTNKDAIEERNKGVARWGTRTSIVEELYENDNKQSKEKEGIDQT